MTDHQMDARRAFAEALRSGDPERIRHAARALQEVVESRRPRHSMAGMLALLFGIVPSTLTAVLHGRVRSCQFVAQERGPQDDVDAVGDLLWSAMIDDAARSGDAI